MRKETKWQQTGLSDCRVDGERLANDLQQAIERLSDEGYSIKSITSIMSGEYKYQSQEVGGDAIKLWIWIFIYRWLNYIGRKECIAKYRKGTS